MRWQKRRTWTNEKAGIMKVSQYLRLSLFSAGLTAEAPRDLRHFFKKPTVLELGHFFWKFTIKKC